MAKRVKINGQVCSNNAAGIYRYWGYSDVVCPNDVRDAIDSLDQGEELVLEINSGGGSVYPAFEIWTMLQQAENTVAEVHSLAASAASVIAVGCKKVLMSPVGNAMIHLSCSQMGYANAEEAREYAQMLDTIDNGILDAYVRKVHGKTSREQLHEAMKKNTWLTAQQAIDMGLADGMMFSESGNETQSQSASWEINDIVASVYDAGGFEKLPPLNLLRERMTAEKKAECAENTGDQNKSKGMMNMNGSIEMTAQEIKTVDDLMAAYPDLMQQATATAAAQERNRISGIEDVALPGFESIVAAAKADPSKNAGDVAMAIIAEQKKQGTNYLNNVKKDAAELEGIMPTEAPAENKVDDKTENEEAAAADVATFLKGGC